MQSKVYGSSVRLLNQLAGYFDNRRNTITMFQSDRSLLCMYLCHSLSTWFLYSHLVDTQGFQSGLSHCEFSHTSVSLCTNQQVSKELYDEYGPA